MVRTAAAMEISLPRIQTIISQWRGECTSLSPAGDDRTRARTSASRGMLYLAYQFHVDVMTPIRALARSAQAAISLRSAMLNPTAAAWELIARSGLSHARPDYGIDHVVVGNEEVAVVEDPALVT